MSADGGRAVSDRLLAESQVNRSKVPTDHLPATNGHRPAPPVPRRELPPEPPEEPVMVDLGDGPGDQTMGWRARLVSGGAFLHEASSHVPALWGTGDDVLWSEGEPPDPHRSG